MSKAEYILSIDQGTTSSRAIVFDSSGRVVGKSQREFRQIYPKSGWVEHNPLDILGSQMGVMSEVIASCGLSSTDIGCLGITNQRETVVVWDKQTGQPIYNAVVWQCRRTAGECALLKEEGYEDLIYERTGLTIDAYFSATKLKWILDNVEGARKRAESGQLLFGTVDCFLLWHLSGGRVHATDYTNASRTMLFNIHKLCWDDDLLQIFDVPRAMLPDVYPSGHIYGYVNKSVLGSEIPIAAIAGDQQSALFGQLCLKRGEVKNTYGTGCFLLMNTGKEPVISKRGLLTTPAACLEGEGSPNYALEGSVFMGGAIVQWLRDEMRMLKSAADTEKYASSVKDTMGVYMVPAFVGLGAPYWDSQARGTVTGLTRGVKKEHFIRAALESIAYQVFDLVHAMERDTGAEVDSLTVDGGACANNFLMQFQADVLNAKVVRPEVSETTALGACYLAGLTTGIFSNTEQLKKNFKAERTFIPAMEESRRRELIEGWKVAVMRARFK